MNILTNCCLKKSSYILDNISDFLEYENLISDKNIAIGIYNFPSLNLIKYNKYYYNLLKNVEVNIKKFNDSCILEIKRKDSKNESFLSILLKFTDIKDKQIFDNISIDGEKKYYKCTITPIYEKNTLQYIIFSFVDNTENIKLDRENKLLKAKIKDLERNNGYVNTLDNYFMDNNLHSSLYKKNNLEIMDYLIKVQSELELKLKNQEEFFSFIAHEFKTPLTIINSSIQLLESIYSSELSNNVKKYIDKINISTLQQLRLVNNLLDISRASSGYLNINFRNYDIISVTRLISESVKSFALRKNVNLEFICDIKEKIIAIDDEKYERILLNLLSNAIKFTPQNKSVKVIIEDKDTFINIYVKDEGVGIPKNKQEEIFHRFVQVNNDLTRKSEGTGIGLCLVKLLVEAIGGKINLKSTVGKGSTFIIELPNKRMENKNVDMNLMDNRLVQTLNMEFSNIYFE